MTWQNILKTEGEVNNILESYKGLESITKMIIEDIKHLVVLLKHDPQMASEAWESMRGGIMDLEGTFEGIKEVNVYITKLLGDV